MKAATTTLEEMVKKGTALGFKLMPKDHPMRSEGLSIILSPRAPKQSRQKDTDSLNDSDTQNKS